MIKMKYSKLYEQMSGTSAFPIKLDIGKIDLGEYRHSNASKEILYDSKIRENVTNGLGCEEIDLKKIESEHNTWEERLYGSEIQKRIQKDVTDGLGFDKIKHGYSSNDAENLQYHLHLMNLRTGNYDISDEVNLLSNEVSNSGLSDKQKNKVLEPLFDKKTKRMEDLL